MLPTLIIEGSWKFEDMTGPEDCRRICGKATARRTAKKARIREYIVGMRMKRTRERRTESKTSLTTNDSNDTDVGISKNMV